MEEELPELDFGPINTVVPPGCCNDDPTTGEDENGNSPKDIVGNHKIIGVYEELNNCNCFPFFLVNLHRDLSYSFTWQDGRSLTQAEIDQYCRQIAGAQSFLRNHRRWFELGRGLGKWDPSLNRAADGDGGVEDEGTQYQPAGFFNNSHSSTSCSVQGPINNNTLWRSGI